jgi:hypothetical protein
LGVSHEKFSAEFSDIDFFLRAVTQPPSVAHTTTTAHREVMMSEEMGQSLELHVDCDIFMVPSCKCRYVTSGFDGEN